MSKQELRSALLGMACSLNEEKCISQSRALFKQYVESNGTSRYVQHTIQGLNWLFWVTLNATAGWEGEPTLFFSSLVLK